MNLKIFLLSTFLIYSLHANNTASKIVISTKDRTLSKYYYNLGKEPIWIKNNNQIKDLAFDLINKIKQDKILEPHINKLFEFEKIENLLENRDYLSKNNLIELELLLTKTYNQYMTYLSKGYIKWEIFLDELKKLEEEDEIKAKWAKYEVRKDFILLLKESLEKDDINFAINEVNYTFPYAKDLENEIKRLEEISQSGGYITVPETKTILKKGNSYPQIRQIRQRLYQSNDLDSIFCESEIKNCLEYYDQTLFNAVITFQKRYGLIADGIIGEKTIEKLNTSVEEKIKTVRINLERMRWLPRNLGNEFILINIPAYKLKFYEDKEVQLKMNIIVGKKRFPTPIFSHRMSQIIVNPYWKIPQTIVKEEIIPKLVKNSDYLENEKINVHENWDTNSLKYDVSSVNWNMYLNNDLIGTPKEAPMRFIQTPGGTNPLGKIKFLFPNQYSVYLHDTPEKQYFNLNEKTLSHGCIRLEKPFELFEKIIFKEEKSFEKIKTIQSFEEKDFKLSKKIPIHIVYLTAWVENNRLQFRDDIYNYDKIQAKLLF